MAPLYYWLHASNTPGIKFDSALYDEMKLVNDARIEELKKEINNVEDGEEESAAVESWIKLGQYYAQIGDRSEAKTTLRKALDMTPASNTGSRIDILFDLARIDFFFADKIAVRSELDQLKLAIDKGGDWERRNRYKTYNGLFLMWTRQFKQAADLLLDSLATFTSTEIASYDQIVEYAVLCGAIALERVDLKQRVIDCPEVLSRLPSRKSLEPITMLTNSLYTCEYASFFQALATVETTVLRADRYLSAHSSYYVREMRRIAYAQLLESYKTLSIKSMAEAFGVSPSFVDADLARFIPQKRLNCVIDRVNGIVITNRPDNKNAQYLQLIKQGDALLTKLQKYGAAVRLSGAERA